MIEGIKNSTQKNNFDTFWKNRSVTNLNNNTTTNIPIIDLQRINEMVEFDEHMEKIQRHVKTVVLIRKK